MTTTIQKWGNSQGIRIPKSILDELFLKENDQVDIITECDSIVIKKTTKKRRAKKSLDERFEKYDGNYQCSEYEWGEPVGREVW